MYCQKCGKQINDLDIFCPYCGIQTSYKDGQKVYTNNFPEKQIQIEKDPIKSREQSTNIVSTSNGYLVAGILFFGYNIIEIILINYARDFYYYDFINITFFIIKLVLIPFVLAIYSKNRTHKILLVIIGLLLIFIRIALNVYQPY